jgi:hypothetical protein
LICDSSVCQTARFVNPCLLDRNPAPFEETGNGVPKMKIRAPLSDGERASLSSPAPGNRAAASTRGDDMEEQIAALTAELAAQ